jgi:hypothetical protein
MLRLASSTSVPDNRKFHLPIRKVILGLAFVLLMCMASSNNYYAYAASRTNAKVEILGLHTAPELVKVNDTFTISATVLNNSTNNKITLEFLGCGGSPLSAVFNKNVKVENRFCNIMTIGRVVELLPGQSISVNAPDYLHVYRASKAGNTTAAVTLQYGVENNNTYTSVQHMSKSKSFVFPIIKPIKFPFCPLPGRPCL